MGSAEKTGSQAPLSIVHGRPLSEEPGQGAHTIVGYARETTTRYADREVAVLYTPDGVMRWTYRELWDRSVEIARALIACGVGKGSRVGILMTNRPEFIASVFGVALAGGVSVIFNTFSTPVELEHLLKMSCVSTLLFESQVVKKDFAAILRELEPAIASATPGKIVSTRFPFLERTVALDRTDEGVSGGIQSWSDFLRIGGSVSPDRVDARAATTTPADLAVIFFSSGTTGMPKGIMHRNRAVAIQWWRWPRTLELFGDDVRVWTANGFFWSGNFSMTIGSAMSSGGTIILQRTFDAEEAVDLIQREKVTQPLAYTHQWARMEETPNYANADFSCVRFANYHLMAALHPSMKIICDAPNAFGTTETLTINTSGVEAEPDKRNPDGYGLPLPGNTLKIIDPMTGAPVPRGERGEIVIKGPTLMMGYLGKTQEECFDAEGFYRTGDGGYVDESGWLYWEGRLSDIIKTGGANVSPLEIDAVIAAYPGVKLSQTVGVPHETLGELVVACIVPQDGATLDESGLRAFLKERLASYKIPRKILFMAEHEMSMTGSAKVKAGQLREIVAKRLSAETRDKAV